MADRYGIYRRMDNYVHSNCKAGMIEEFDPHIAMLNILREPYSDLTNYNEFLNGLREVITDEEAEVWLAYPEFFYSTIPWTIEDVEKIYVRNYRNDFRN